MALELEGDLRATTNEWMELEAGEDVCDGDARHGSQALIPGGAPFSSIFKIFRNLSSAP